MNTLRYISLILLLLFSMKVLAQNDSPQKAAEDTVKQKPKPKIKLMTRPRRAALLSAALPGAGQVYNKSLWYIRVPVIYGAGIAVGYAVRFNHQQYVRYRDAYLYKMDNNPLTEPEPLLADFNSDGLRSRRDRFRRDRDFNLILATALYVLNIAEAATTAHLKKFDVSDNLSMRVAPALLQKSQGGLAPGLSLNFTFNKRR